MKKLNELRAIAEIESAISPEQKSYKFEATFNPATVKVLLDVIDMQREALEELYLHFFGDPTKILTGVHAKNRSDKFNTLVKSFVTLETTTKMLDNID